MAQRASNSAGGTSSSDSCRRVWLNQPRYSTTASSASKRVPKTRPATSSVFRVPTKLSASAFVVGVGDRADRGGDAQVGEPLRVTETRVLAAAVGVMHQLAYRLNSRARAARSRVGWLEPKAQFRLAPRVAGVPADEGPVIPCVVCSDDGAPWAETRRWREFGVPSAAAGHLNGRLGARRPSTEKCDDSPQKRTAESAAHTDGIPQFEASRQRLPGPQHAQPAGHAVSVRRSAGSGSSDRSATASRSDTSMSRSVAGRRARAWSVRFASVHAYWAIGATGGLKGERVTGAPPIRRSEERNDA